mgnify:CR=1 FL=1
MYPDYTKSTKPKNPYTYSPESTPPTHPRSLIEHYAIKVLLKFRVLFATEQGTFNLRFSSYGKNHSYRNLSRKTPYKYRFDSGEFLNIQETLSSQNLSNLSNYVGDDELIVIDKAHKIPNIGINLKLIVDHISGIRIIATGSSSFDLLCPVGEPLVGRKRTLNLFPMSQLEMKKLLSEYDLKTYLDTFLIYGGYPDVLKSTTNSVKLETLNELVQGYLLKDILELDKVKNSKIIQDLCGFSRNLRKEITRKSRYYFYDNGVRNAIISNFNETDKRDDGPLCRIRIPYEY